MTYAFDKEKNVLGKTETGFAAPTLELKEGEVFSQAKKNAFAAECLKVEGVELVEIIVCQSFFGSPSIGSSWQISSHGTKYWIYKLNLDGKWFLSRNESKVA